MNSVASGVQTSAPLSPFAVPECAACTARRCHTPEEDRQYHPLAGHGFTPETGWTYSKDAALTPEVIPAGGKA